MSNYKKVIVIGATSGIGRALAEKFIASGASVIVVGRRKGNLDSLIAAHGPDKVYAIEFDITKLDAIPAFVKDVFATHQDVDCVLLNSGIQRRVDFSDPEAIDMQTVMEEFTTNYFSYLALTKEMLQVLQPRQSPVSLVYVSSGLAMIPIPRCTNYCASKAALHHFILCLRQQTRKSNIKVIEIYPPAVQTELHDEKYQPDIKNGRSLGIPLVEFTEAAWAGLNSDAEDIPVGTSKMTFENMEKKRIDIFDGMMKRMQG